jgi:mRNA export factor
MSFGGTTTQPHNPNNDAEVPNAANDGISSLSWAPNSNLLVGTSWDNEVRCWEVAANGTAAPKAAISHAGPVLCSAWSPDGARVYTGSCDKTAKVWDLATNQSMQVAAHDQPIKSVFWAQEKQFLVTAAWDKTIKYWDGKSPTPGATLQLPERPYAVDVRGSLMVVATADRKIIVVNLTQPTVKYAEINSPLKYQSRCIACFPDQRGFCLGSIEGRVAVHHVTKADESKNFAFKCHRDGNDIYAVNCLAFHPTFGTFATTGGDGTFNFWDKDSRQRLKAFSKANLPVPVGAFNHTGNIFAYAVSYDWSRGSEHYNPRTNHLLLHSVPETEIKSRANAKKGFGGR